MRSVGEKGGFAYNMPTIIMNSYLLHLIVSNEINKFRSEQFCNYIRIRNLF